MKFLESRAAILRALGDQDIDELMAFQNDPQLKKLTMGWPMPVSRVKVSSWLETLSQADDEVLLGIVKKETDDLVGTIRLMKIDWRHRKAELGIYIGHSEHQRKGLGKEALKLILDWAFHDLGLHKICLRALRENSQAMAAFESVGFREEGTMREDFYQDGEYKDVAIMGMLDGEYIEKRGHK